MTPMNYLAASLFSVFALCGINKALLAQPFTKKYILAFHHCALPVCGGPQNHTVMLAESDNGENWSLCPNFPSYTGSVPDVITRGNKLYIYTPGQVKRYDQLTNQWDASAVPVSINDSLGNPVQFVDPSAYVDDKGMLCLFFLNSSGIIGDPAQCVTPPCTAYFDSAVEVPGSDGTQFILQSGNRIVYTTNTNFKPTDPDIFRSGNTYYQYISYGSGTIVYSCNTLHGNYSLVASLPAGYLTQNNAGVPCGMYKMSEQQYYSYGHRNTANGTEITLAKHPDFGTQPNYNVLFTGNAIGLGNVQVASPGITENGFLVNGLTDQSTSSALIISTQPRGLHILSAQPLLSISIFDLSGKPVYIDSKSSSCYTFQTNTLSSGMYIVLATDAHNHIYHQKFIIP